MVVPVFTLTTTMKTFYIKLTRGGKLRVDIMADLYQVHDQFVKLNGCAEKFAPGAPDHGQIVWAFFKKSHANGVLGTICLPDREILPQPWDIFELTSHEACHASTWASIKDRPRSPVDEEQLCTLTGEITGKILAELMKG